MVATFLPHIAGHAAEVVAYLRVSTERQATDGDGLGAQRAAIEKLCAANNWTITSWHADEGISGAEGIGGRYGLGDALSAITKGAAKILVVYRLDRLARDLAVQEQVLSQVWRSGGDVVSCSDAETAYCKRDDATDPSRKMIRQILGAVAEYERSMIKLRMNAGKARARAQGRRVSGVIGVGWERAEDGTERAGQLVLQIITMRHHGFSLKSIAEALDNADIPTPRGAKTWNPQTIKDICDRAAERGVEPIDPWW